MSSTRFHKAAKDGLLDVLNEATRKDANGKDEDSMTPVLWAAFEDKLDALRLLCGRGGDPDKCDQFGNTALHLASARGNFNCVKFLVQFGVNIYALDIDKHSAKDLAAINNRDEILRYLDAAAAKFEATDKKKSKMLKELAEKNCEKRMREYMKRQQKLENENAIVSAVSANNAPKSSSGMLSSIKQKIWSSQGNLSKTGKEAASQGTKFSDLTGSKADEECCIDSKPKAGKGHTRTSGGSSGKVKDSDFKIGEIEADGRRTITSLTGFQRDSEVLYVGTFNSSDDAGKRTKISEVFEVDEMCGSDLEGGRHSNAAGYGTLSRSFSQPDILSDAREDGDLASDTFVQRAPGLFDRPMLGTIAFRRSVTAALSELRPECDDSTLTQARSNKQRSFLNISDSDSDGGEGFSEDDQEIAGSPLQRFLAVWGLEEYLSVFQKQQIDLDTLMLLTEADLKSLNLPLGPFRKLTFAIQERSSALSNPGVMQDSRL